MIYLLYGSDNAKARAKAHAIIDSLLAKKPGALLFRLDAESWSDAELLRLEGGAGLFESNYIVLLDRIFENEDAKDSFLGKLTDIESSTNVFLVLEGSLPKAALDKISKYASKVQEFAKTEPPKKVEFNNFALADALGKRDKKGLWSLYQEALLEEKAPEELHGILFWQLKSMLSASLSRSAQDSGLKPFVYSKSLRYADNYGEETLKRKSAELISLYHDARRGGDEMEIGLEKWILNI